MPIIKMLSTGDEVLHGQILDSNAAWLADYFFQQGAAFLSRSTIGDNLTELINTIQQQVNSCDILIINGGLGPTSDDLTSEAVASALQRPLIYYPEWAAEIQRYFNVQQRRIPSSNFKQAFLPQGAHLFANPIGTACGFMLQHQQCQIYCTPGVPTEFKQMMQQQIYPFMQQNHHFSNQLICLKLSVLGYFESELANLFADLTLPEEITLGFRANYPIIEIKLTAPSQQYSQQQMYWAVIQQRVKPQICYEATQDFFGDGIYQIYAKNYSLLLWETITCGALAQQLVAQHISFQHSLITPYITELSFIEWQQQLQQLPLTANQLLITTSGLFEQHLYFALRTTQYTHYWYFNYHSPIKTPEQIQKTAVILAQHLLKQYVILNRGRVIAPYSPSIPNIHPFEVCYNEQITSDEAF